MALPYTGDPAVSSGTNANTAGLANQPMRMSSSSSNNSDASSSPAADAARLRAQSMAGNQVQNQVVQQQQQFAALRQRNQQQQQQQHVGHSHGGNPMAQQSRPLPSGTTPQGFGYLPQGLPVQYTSQPGQQHNQGPAIASSSSNVHLGVQQYGMAHPPAYLPYNQQGRRASSPAAIFVPGGGMGMTSQLRPTPPGMLHHPTSDVVMQRNWQTDQQQQEHPPPDMRERQFAGLPLQGMEQYHPPPPSSGYGMQPHPNLQGMYGYQPQLPQGQMGGPAGMDMKPGLHGYLVDDGEDDDRSPFGVGGSSIPPFDPYRVKHRKRTTPEQLAVLESAFDQNSKPSAVERKTIAEQIGMTSRAVQVWFQNRRQKRKLLERKLADANAAQEGEADMYGRQLGLGPSTTIPPGQHFFYANQMSSVSPTQASYPSSDMTEAEVDCGWSSTPANGVHHPGHDVPSHLRQPINQASRIQSSDNLRRAATVQGQVGGAPGRPTPMISQVRRGSLPYPPPMPAGLNQLQYHHQHQQARGAYPAPAHQHGIPVPLHMAVSVDDLRRSSLPGNARSVSAGPLAQTRSDGLSQGGPAQQEPSAEHQRGLSPIEDQELTPDASGIQGLNFASSSTHKTAAQYAMGDRMAHQSAVPMTFTLPSHLPAGQMYPVSTAEPMFPQDYAAAPATTVPMPNPGFSFGTPQLADATQVHDSDPSTATTNAYAQPQSGQSTEQQPLPINPAFHFRGRIGSMASILSQATTDGGTTTDGNSSDWDRNPWSFPHGIASSDAPLVTPLDAPVGGLVPPAISALPPGFQADVRRASAPAELLAKFSTLDVELPGALLHKPSPLGSMVVVSPPQSVPLRTDDKSQRDSRVSPTSSLSTVSRSPVPAGLKTTNPSATQWHRDTTGTGGLSERGSGSADRMSAVASGIDYETYLPASGGDMSMDLGYMHQEQQHVGGQSDEVTPVLGRDAEASMFGQFGDRQWAHEGA